MRLRCSVAAAGRELEMRAAARESEEDAVVSGVAFEAADLGQSELVAIEADDLVESIGVAGESDVDPAIMATRK